MLIGNHSIQYSLIDHAIYRLKVGLFLHHRPTRAMAYLLLLQDVADDALRRERILQNHIDLFAESDKYLLGCFSLPRAVLKELCNSTAEPYQTV